MLINPFHQSFCSVSTPQAKAALHHCYPSAMASLHFAFRPVVSDQHTAARAYFLCAIAILFLESMTRLPEYLASLGKRGKMHFVLPLSSAALLRCHCQMLTNTGEGSQLKRRQRNHSTLRVWLHKLIVLPSPAPFLTRHNVPSLLRCLIFTGLNVLWGWNRIRYSTDYQIYGWLTIANAGLALLLPTRTNLFSLVARIPSPILFMYHRWAGVAAVVHASLHFGLTAQQYVKTDQFGIVLENARIRVGIMAWASLALIFLTSLRLVRRRAFELFYYTHFLFLVLVAGGLYHAAYGPEFLLPGLILWALDRAVRFYHNFRSTALTEVTHCFGDVTKLKFEGMPTTTAGQIAWVQIPSVSFVNWHPFTIASAPGDKVGTIAIRALGGYTNKVQRLSVNEGSKESEQAGLNRSALAGQIKIRLDGPYGVEPVQWTQYPVVLLVAGGIGITPGISIASHIVKQAARGGLVGGERHIHLLWSVGDIQHACWFEKELKSIASLASRPDVLVSLSVSIHVTSRSASTQRPRAGQEEHQLGGAMIKYDGPGQVHDGRPNIMQWFQHVKEMRPGFDAAVSLCGPPSLIADARKAAASVSGRQGLFHVQEEVFQF